MRQLRSIFPQTTLQKESEEHDEVLNRVVQFIETSTAPLALPLHIRGTAFQKQVWKALRGIRAGRTATYKELALKLGATAQKIGEACAANPLVSCPRNTRYFAGGQLAVFQGASEAPISESYGSSEQRGKTANWPRPKGLR